MVRNVEHKILYKVFGACLCMMLCIFGGTVQAEEQGDIIFGQDSYMEDTYAGDFFDEGTYTEDTYEDGAYVDGTNMGDAYMDGNDQFGEEETLLVPQETASVTGTYTIAADWVKVENLSTQEQEIYKMSGYEGVENTSTITCSYLDTNYTVFEYEQLRDMLTNNLMYSNVNAQISVSAGYTENQDYLYIMIADDSAQDYRDIYYYVVGNMRCFCVEVKEYRTEAQQLEAAALDTPQIVGQKVAAKFIWN